MLSAQLLLSAFLAIAASTDGRYTLETTDTTSELQVGGKGVLKLQIVPKEGYKVSTEAPLKIALSGKGISLSKSKLGHKDKKDKSSEAPAFDVKFSAKKPGEGAINVDAMFFVCDDKICERVKDTVSVSIAVKDK